MFALGLLVNTEGLVALNMAPLYMVTMAFWELLVSLGRAWALLGASGLFLGASFLGGPGLLWEVLSSFGNS